MLFGEKVDKDSSDAYKADLRLRKIGFVFQTFNLLATLSAFENVELPMVMMGKLSRSESKKRAKALLDMVGLRDRYGHLPSELSGGEQQRVTVSLAGNVIRAARPPEWSAASRLVSPADRSREHLQMNQSSYCSTNQQETWTRSESIEYLRTEVEGGGGIPAVVRCS